MDSQKSKKGKKYIGFSTSYIDLSIDPFKFSINYSKNKKVLFYRLSSPNA